MGNGVVAGLRQLEAELAAFFSKEDVRDLDKDARTVARVRISADGAAVLKVLKNEEGVFNDLVALRTGEVGDEANTTRIAPLRWISQTLFDIRVEPLLFSARRVVEENDVFVIRLGGQGAHLAHDVLA